MIATRERERQTEAYIANHVSKFFPNAQLIQQNEVLPGGNIIDLHLRTVDGEDIFVEVKATPIRRTYLGQLINYYTAISNLEPALRSFRIVLIGDTIDPLLKKQIKGMKTEFLSLREIESSPEEVQSNQIQLSPTEARLIVSLESRKVKLVTPSDTSRLLDCSKNHARVLLSRLQRKGWVDRISKGKYAFVPPASGYEERFPSLNPLLAGSALISPYYYSYWTANAHYGLTTQMPTTIYLATTKRKPLFRWKNNDFKFVTLTKRKFFGFTKVKVQTAEVNMADLEKTIIDSVDNPSYAGGIEEVIRVIYRAYGRVNASKLVGYALRMKTHAVCQRLGFLLDVLAAKGLIGPLRKDLRGKLLSGVGKSLIYVGPKELGGLYSSDWRIIRTLPEKQMLSETIVI